jgi:hypothetical protein
MSLAPSKSVLRVKDGYIYGWSGSKSLTSSAITLLNYTNPSEYFLTRLMIGIDWSGMQTSETLSYTMNVDSQNLFVEKIVIGDIGVIGGTVQPKMIEFVIPPNSTVKVQATQSGNNGSISCILSGYKI